MAYQIETIKQSQKIFYYLLEHHELREEKAPELHKAYIEQDEVQTLVKSQADAADSHVETYCGIIYLIPGQENNYLGYSKGQLKKELCRSNATDKDYYLVQFVILVLLLEFYDGQGSSSKTRDFILLGELQNSITDRLNEGVARYSEDEQSQNGMAFTAMREVYESLKSDEKSSRKKTTKEGFMSGILRFLQEQGLIDYIEQDEMIKTTRKLDNFMDWELLNKNKFYRIQKIIGAEKNEQN